MEDRERFAKFADHKFPPNIGEEMQSIMDQMHDDACKMAASGRGAAEMPTDAMIEAGGKAAVASANTRASSDPQRLAADIWRAMQAATPPAGPDEERTDDVAIGEFIAQYEEGAQGVCMDHDSAALLARELHRLRGLAYARKDPEVATPDTAPLSGEDDRNCTEVAGSERSCSGVTDFAAAPPVIAPGEERLNDRKAVNTILSRLLEQVQPKCPDMAERIRRGNEACDAILALATPADDGEQRG